MTSNINQDDKKKKKKLLIFLILFILLDIILLVVLLVGRTTLSPDYAPVNEEKYAEDIGDDGADKLKQTKGGGAVSLEAFGEYLAVISCNGLNTVFIKKLYKG